MSRGATNRTEISQSSEIIQRNPRGGMCRQTSGLLPALYFGEIAWLNSRAQSECALRQPTLFAPDTNQIFARQHTLGLVALEIVGLCRLIAAEAFFVAAARANRGNVFRVLRCPDQGFKIVTVSSVPASSSIAVIGRFPSCFRYV